MKRRNEGRGGVKEEQRIRGRGEGKRREGGGKEEGRRREGGGGGAMACQNGNNDS